MIKMFCGKTLRKAKNDFGLTIPLIEHPQTHSHIEPWFDINPHLYFQ